MKIISGGQSGVDRAALDFPDPPGLLAKYPSLQETPLSEPAQRTEWNVRDADACLILIDAAGLDASAGTTRANELAHHYRKPVLIVNLRDSKTAEQAGLWLRVQQARQGGDLKLAIGGPRESEAPGIYKESLSFLESLLE
jgi:hypothetical protein